MSTPEQAEGGFRNEPILELRRAPARDSLLQALRELDERLPLEVPVLVGGDRGAVEGIDSTDPGAPERLVARAGRAGAAEAAAAVEAATRGFGDWGRRPAAERAEVLRGGRRSAPGAPRSSWPRSRSASAPSPGPRPTATCARPSTSSSTTRARPSSWSAGATLVQAPGERNTMRYAPRGVAAVIAPWNFPLAIPCGMTAAALAAGNAAVLKPAEQSPGSAGVLVEALHAAGVPPDALALLPGFGEAGEALVRDPRVHVIAFTGSGAVGLEILRAAADTPDEQAHVKRVVSEMGGKNCVIVDSDADLDDAVPGDRPVRLQLRGPEVLGRGAGARARERGRHAARAPGGSCERARGWARPRASPRRCRR